MSTNIPNPSREGSLWPDEPKEHQASEALSAHADAEVQVTLPAGIPPAPATDGRGLLVWKDLLYLAAFYFACGVVFTLAVSAAVVFMFNIPPSELPRSPARGPILIVSQGLLSVATLGFLYAMIRGRSSAPFWPSVGWNALRSVASRTVAIRYVLGGVGLAMAVGVAGQYVGDASHVPLQEMFRTRGSVILLTVLGILVAPVVEETIFRGCIYPVIARRFGIATGVVATGALFGLAHAQQLGGAWGQIGLLVGVGMILTYVRARAGTVLASYLVHLGYNSILFAGFYVATGGLQNLPGS